MALEQAAFDAAVRALVGSYGGETVTLQLQTAIAWGTPHQGLVTPA